jgi:hypothetical protein
MTSIDVSIPLCDLTRLQGVLDKLKAPWNLETIEGGNHSFRLPKYAGRPPRTGVRPDLKRDDFVASN